MPGTKHYGDIYADYTKNMADPTPLTTEAAIANIEQGFKDRAERNAKLSEEMTSEEIKEYWESRSGQPYGLPDKAFVETAKAYAKPLAEAFTDAHSTPVTIWSFGFEADEVLAVWAALRTYLRALANQESEDLEMLARIIKIMTQLRPSAVKASKALSLEAVRSKE